ncbi:DUF5067 domain-containing protein [Candidatus Enterococcus clewellii]|nr:DUF5067 domain-containing protein [Enterococcus sp. 9E7_DIV0242]
MKKIFGLGLLFSSVFLLAACGSGDDKKDTATSSSSVPVAQVSEESKAAESVADDTTFENDNYKFVIKGTEELSNTMFPEKKILAIEIEYTNKGADATSPWMAFATSIKGIQETDVTEELLSGANGQFPADYKPELVQMGDTDVKSGATVDAVVGFDILYPGSPVKMMDFMETGKFERIVETTE